MVDDRQQFFPHFAGPGNQLGNERLFSATHVQPRLLLPCLNSLCRQQLTENLHLITNQRTLRVTSQLWSTLLDFPARFVRLRCDNLNALPGAYREIELLQPVCNQEPGVNQLPTVPCVYCGRPTTYTATKHCDPCHAATNAPIETLRKILAEHDAGKWKRLADEKPPDDGTEYWTYSHGCVERLEWLRSGYFYAPNWGEVYGVTHWAAIEYPDPPRSA